VENASGNQIRYAIFANAPIVPTVVEVQVGKIYFDAPCRYCRGGRRATTNIQPIDALARQWLPTSTSAIRTRNSSSNARW
jgi:hypothetical protein